MNLRFGPVMQLGFVVPDLDRAMEHWTGNVGVGPFYVMSHIKFAEALYRGQPTDEGVPPHQTARPERERGRHHRRERLGDCRHRQAQRSEDFRRDDHERRATEAPHRNAMTSSRVGSGSQRSSHR